MGVVTMLLLPNDHRDKIVCQACGEVLRRKPMQTAGEALLVWLVMLGAVVPLVMFGGNAGVGATLCLVALLGWVAPWQGMTYELSVGENEVREQLPPAKLLPRPTSESAETGVPPPGSPQSED